MNNSDSALALLREGNARFAADNPQPWRAGRERRTELTVEASPFACIITCSDARVSPEILFDQSLGDLFVVRLAGNVVSPEVVASVEFAVENFRVPLVVVLGHTQCAAIQTALNERLSRMSAPMRSLLARISLAQAAARSKGFSGAELITATVRENARIGAEDLVKQSMKISDAVHRDRVKILSALYDLRSGEVQW